MFVRPHDLADRMFGPQQTEIFTLPIESARLKAREILDRAPQAGYAAVVETGGNFPTVGFSSRRGSYRLPASFREPSPRPVIIIWMRPKVRLDLAPRRQLDHVHPWRITRRPA